VERRPLRLEVEGELLNPLVATLPLAISTIAAR